MEYSLEALKLCVVADTNGAAPWQAIFTSGANLSNIEWIKIVRNLSNFVRNFGISFHLYGAKSKS